MFLITAQATSAASVHTAPAFAAPTYTACFVIGGEEGCYADLCHQFNLDKLLCLAEPRIMCLRSSMKSPAVCVATISTGPFPPGS